ncbi:MAG TPA: 3-oxoacyl-ACP reductase FabG [Acidimicrobiales bacterium]|nr:3-oxoacyl-ACP reductase FabG [Acidimicrobiales bacterium]
MTGAAQGIGLAIAQTFAGEGAAVVIGDVNLKAAERAVDELAAAGAKVVAVHCDVVSESEVESLIGRCVGEFGSLDVMVNNAGVTRDATMRRMSVEDFRTVIDVHLQGAWLGTRAAAAVMREQQRGSIINMSSISGKAGNAGQTNYSTAKAGLVGLTKAAAKELAHLGVRVNAIQPGLIRTAMTEAMRADIWEQRLAEIPMGRAGEVADVANVALFLASDLSSYMTGTVLEVTGGRYM